MASTITLRIPPKMKKALQEISEAEGRALSDLVRESLQRIIALHQFELLRSKTLKTVEKRRTYSDEEIFKKMS